MNNSRNLKYYCVIYCAFVRLGVIKIVSLNSSEIMRWSMQNKIITISRQFGCNGRLIGKKVAEELGIAYYDRELIHLIASRSGFCQEFVEKSSEYATSSPFDYFPFIRSVGGIGSGDIGSSCLTTIDRLQVAVKEVVEQIAQQEASVIVGRGADYFLREREDVLKIFLYAKEEHRVDVLLGRSDLDSSEKALEELRQKDSNRRKNYKHYTGRDWGKPHYYDLCLNTGSLGIDLCVNQIVNAYTHCLPTQI